MELDIRRRVGCEATLFLSNEFAHRMKSAIWRYNIPWTFNAHGILCLCETKM